MGLPLAPFGLPAAWCLAQERIRSNKEGSEGSPIGVRPQVGGVGGKRVFIGKSRKPKGGRWGTGGWKTDGRDGGKGRDNNNRKQERSVIN